MRIPRGIALTFLGLVVAFACQGQGTSPTGQGSPQAAPGGGKTHDVKLTWMGMANWLIDVDGNQVLLNTYFSRLPQSDFTGEGPFGIARSVRPKVPDTKAYEAVTNAYGTLKPQFILTGHSNWDHSWETGRVAKMTGAKVVGPPSTCFQAFAQGIAANQCTPVVGGEQISLVPGLKVAVVHLNHSGDSVSGPTLHNPVELGKAPAPEADGGLRPGTLEDFPNGGGARGFLFSVDSPGKPFTFFFQDSASPTDFLQPVVVAGTDYGIPAQNIMDAMKKANVDRVDLWISTGSKGLAQLEMPILKPKFVIPNHWEGLFNAIEKGLPTKYSDPPLEAYIADSGAKLLPPCQYFDSWKAGASGVSTVSNSAIKQKLGLKDCQF